MESMFDQQATWKMDRIGKFTSSKVHELLKSGRKKDQYWGEGALTYIGEVIGEILTGESPEVVSKATEWGAANELDALLEYQNRTGESVEMFGVGNPHFFPYGRNAGGSPDGLTDTKVIEAKCPWNSGNHTKFLLMKSCDELKKSDFDYYCQAQMNMICTGRREAVLVSYDPRVVDHNLRLAMIPIRYDDAIVGQIKERIEKAATLVQQHLKQLGI